MTTPDLEELTQIAQIAASRRLTLSGGHEVDDVAQAAMIDYLRYAETHEIDNPGGLIQVMARRRAMKYRDRWEHRRRWDAVDAIGGNDDQHGDLDDRAAAVGQIELFAHDGNPWTPIAAEADRQAVAYAIDQLELTDRNIAKLTYLNEPPLNAPQVAERLELSAGTVRNHLVAIRHALAELLTDEEGL